MTTRLIEKWLPIAALGEESVRERRAMTALPPVYYLHVWWARRPLVASRAAILASLLPENADREKFMHVLGIHGDPVRAQKLLRNARRTGQRVEDPYGYPRAFSYRPQDEERAWISSSVLGSVVLDPTAGGGSIPFEAARVGLTAVANDLNPVAALILRATVEFPSGGDRELRQRFDSIASDWRQRMQSRMSPWFPAAATVARRDIAYLWARTVRCPHCDGVIPLSPNWRLESGGTGVRLEPHAATKRCSFHIVSRDADQSPGTVKQGDAKCPFQSCGRIVSGDEVKRQAQAGGMGEQLYAIVHQQLTESRTRAGRVRESWVRGYRAPNTVDENLDAVLAFIEKKRPEWEAADVIPSELLSELSNYDRGHRLYGMYKWAEFFSPRQLLGHAASVEVYRELLDEHRARGELDERTRAAFVYLAFALDKMLNYNTRFGRWDQSTGRVRSMFDQHNFAFIWSYAEMQPLAPGVGYDWAIEQTGGCVDELVELVHGARGEAGQSSFFDAHPATVRVTNESADALTALADGSVDAVIIDPPYGANVMYAELSDFFYVWLKRTAGLLFPELFRRKLTDKEREAVANAAKFAGQRGAAELATRDYRERMAAIFAECRRVLKADGILTLMFTHKATDAWDALATGLIQAGFVVTASWPINTEAEGSLHIKNKSAANSTIFLACRPRQESLGQQDVTYWEDVEPRVAEAVRRRVQEYQKAGIEGVDLYLACFGPALEEFAKYWPLKRGNPRPALTGNGTRRRAAAVAQVDPYAVTPEDALDAARREVKKWRLDRLLRSSRHPDLDSTTEWFVLAWDAFRAPEFPYDEALRLARVVGIDLDRELVGRVCEKDGSDILLWDSTIRAAKHALGAADGSSSLLDSLHHAAHRARTENVGVAREMIEKSGADKQPAFHEALAAVLEVLPVSSTFTKIEGEAGPVAEAANDFDALEKLRRLAYSDRVPEPEQLAIWADATPGASA